MFPGLDLYFTTVILHSTSERQVGIDLLYVIYVDRDLPHPLDVEDRPAGGVMTREQPEK